MKYLESELTGGLSTYFDRIEYHQEEGIVIIELFHNPEKPIAYKTLKVSEVLSVNEVVLGRDCDCSETIIGAEMKIRNDGTKNVVLHTEQREISIIAKGIIELINTEPVAGGDATR